MIHFPFLTLTELITREKARSAPDEESLISIETCFSTLSSIDHQMILINGDGNRELWILEGGEFCEQQFNSKR
jgi:hypothetical protein